MSTLETSSRVHRFRFPPFDGKKENPVSAAPVVASPKKPEEKIAPLPLQIQPPAITEKDLEAAKTEANAQGRRDGFAAAQAKFEKEAASREEALKSLLEVIGNRITIAAEAHTQVIKEREGLMGKLVVTIARKVAGEALKREPYAPVESLLRECMAHITGQAKITVAASSALATGLKQRIDTLKPMLQGFTGELNVVEDAALLEQDCRVEWGNGNGERNAEALWKAIEEIVVRTNINS